MQVIVFPLLRLAMIKEYLCRHFMAPRIVPVDDRRHESIFNVLLSGLVVFAVLASTVSLVGYVVAQDLRHLPSVEVSILFTLTVSALLYASRLGKPQIAAAIFMTLLMVIAMMCIVFWGIRMATAQLLLALVIVIAGVLFTARQSLIATGVAIMLLSIVGWLQISGLQSPYRGWESSALQASDIVGYGLLFGLIGVVSWLSNRETDHSLKRARASEKALAIERDNLEKMVMERTRQLEDLQAARLLELQPFAEFGRIGASLVHDIANPLTAASLHLEELNRQQHSRLVRQVQRNLAELEKYLNAARNQIRRETELGNFSVGSEVKQIVRLLTHRARRAGVKIEVKQMGRITLYGDVVKFDRMLANIVANAIDASKTVAPTGVPPVVIDVNKEKETVVISISDHGVGIEKQLIPELFEPFYSTKATPRAGLGLGLAMVKQYVENDFKGSIQVTSSVAEGTTFRLRLKGQKS